MALIVSPVPLRVWWLRGERNVYDFNNSPDDVEDRRKDDANKKENKRIVEYALHSRYAFRWLNVCRLVTHEP